MAECKELLDSEPVCENCQHSSRVAKFFCSECMDFLCSFCTADHSENEVLKYHTILEKEGNLFNILHDIKEILYCKEHENLRVYVCEDHSELICEVCIKRNHRNCKKLTKSLISPQNVTGNISTLGEEVQALYEKRSSLLVRRKSAVVKQKFLLMELQAFVEKSIERIDDAIETSDVEKDKSGSFLTIRQKIMKVVSKLNDYTKEQIVANFIHLSTKERCASFRDLKDEEQKTIEAEQFAIKLIQTMNSASMQDIRTDQEYLRVKGENGKRALETALDNNNNIAGLNLKNICSKDTKLDSRKDNIRTCSTKIKDLCANSHTVEDGVYSTSSDSVPDPVTHAQNNASSIKQNVKLVNTESQTSKRDYYKPNTPLLHRNITFSGNYKISDGDEELCCVSGILVLDLDSIVVADLGNNKLKIFDRGFYLKSVATTQGLPESLCRIADYRIAVAIDAKSVHTFSVMNSLQYVSQFKLRYYCRSICSTSAKTIALLLSNIPMRNESGHIQNINSGDKILIEFRNPSNGQVLRVIDKFDEFIETPLYIIQDTSGNIIIGETDQISAFNKDGDRQWFYKSYRNVMLEGTQGMDIDGEGNIYVCGNDSNNIHQVSCTNYKHNRVIIPYVPAPISTAYDSFNDRVMVGCSDSKCLYVYDFV